MSKFTPQQIVQILETPLGRSFFINDPVVIDERKRVQEKYEELTSTPRWFSLEELRSNQGWGYADATEGKMLIPDFTECSIEARVWWLRENVLNAPDLTSGDEPENLLCCGCKLVPPDQHRQGCLCPCHA